MLIEFRYLIAPKLFRMKTLILKPVTLITLLVMTFSCTHSGSSGVKDLDNDQIKRPGKVILTGDKETGNDFFEILIEVSGIHRGGYAVIIPIGDINREVFAGVIYEGLMKHRIMAIYVLDPLPESIRVKSEMVKIKGARVIVFVGKHIQSFLDLPAGNELALAVMHAYENGATVAFIGPSAALAGTKVLRRNPNQPGTFSKGERESYQIRQGMNLIPGTIFDATFAAAVNGNFGNLRGMIMDENVNYIGLRSESMALIHNNKMHNIGPNDLIYYPGRNSNPDRKWKKIVPEGKVRMTK